MARNPNVVPLTVQIEIGGWDLEVEGHVFPGSPGSRDEPPESNEFETEKVFFLASYIVGEEHKQMRLDVTDFIQEMNGDLVEELAQEAFTKLEPEDE